MSMNSILSAGSVVGGASIVVGEAEASLRMLKSLRQSEEAAEASYQVILDNWRNNARLSARCLKRRRTRSIPLRTQ